MPIAGYLGLDLWLNSEEPPVKVKGYNGNMKANQSSAVLRKTLRNERKKLNRVLLMICKMSDFPLAQTFMQ